MCKYFFFLSGANSIKFWYTLKSSPLKDKWKVVIIHSIVSFFKEWLDFKWFNMMMVFFLEGGMRWKKPNKKHNLKQETTKQLSISIFLLICTKMLHFSLCNFTYCDYKKICLALDVITSASSQRCQVCKGPSVFWGYLKWKAADWTWLKSTSFTRYLQNCFCSSQNMMVGNAAQWHYSQKVVLFTLLVLHFFQHMK